MKALYFLRQNDPRAVSAVSLVQQNRPPPPGPRRALEGKQPSTLRGADIRDPSIDGAGRFPVDSSHHQPCSVGVHLSRLDGSRLTAPIGASAGMTMQR